MEVMSNDAKKFLAVSSDDDLDVNSRYYAVNYLLRGLFKVKNLNVDAKCEVPESSPFYYHLLSKISTPPQFFEENGDLCPEL